MAEPDNKLIYKLMLDIQAEQKAIRANMEQGFADIRAEQEVLSAKVGTIATSIVSITNSNHLIAVAVDEHTHQLSDMKTRLGQIENRLERIEKHTDLTHA